jgi:DNA-binding response OmpR family regulator
LSRPIVLMIDDDPDAFDRVYRYFRDVYELHHEPDPFQGIEKAKELEPDAIILDLRMPELDGYEVCRRLRNDEKTHTIPIAVYSVDGDEDTAFVQSLDRGAYIVVEKDKLKRLGAALERLFNEKRITTSTVYKVRKAGNELIIQGKAERVWLNNEEKILRPLCRKLLARFVEKPGVTLTSDELVDLVYEDQLGYAPHDIHRLVHDLRAEVEPNPESPLFIENVRRKGYRLSSEQ